MKNKQYTKEELKELFDSCAKQYILAGNGDKPGVNNFFFSIYVLMFNKYPHIININEDGVYLNINDNDDDIVGEEEENDEYSEEEINSIYTFRNISMSKTMINFYNHFKDTGYYVRNDRSPVIVANNMLIWHSEYDRCIYVLQDNEFLTDEIKNLVVDNKTNPDEESRYFTYITNNGQGFNETMLKIKNADVNLETNYNNDLPDEKIREFLKGKQSGIVMLFGIPGSGKTFYIRNLIKTIKGRPFIVLDASTFNYITDASFIDLLLSNRNAIIILEDCEAMLADRLSGNAQLSTLLNLSDGIIGDSFNFKFICTFNANVGKLDKALLRKGRLKIKYEFKALTPDKVQILAKKLGKEIPEGLSLSLADIFNYGEENGAKEEKKIGFGK